MPMQLRSPLPAFEGVTEWVNGQVTEEQLAGKPVLVHFWSISCHSCKEGLPQILVWREYYSKQYDLQVVGVHMPRSEKDTDIAAAKAIIDEYHLEHPIMMDNAHAITDTFQNDYVPAYYLFDREHQLRHYQAGETGLRLIEQRLQKILGPVEKEG